MSKPVEIGNLPLSSRPLRDLIWLVDTHTGDGHAVFHHVGGVMQYIFDNRKACTVTAITARGERAFVFDVTEQKTVNT